MTRPGQAPMISGSFDQMLGMSVLFGAWLIIRISIVAQRLMLRNWTFVEVCGRVQKARRRKEMGASSQNTSVLAVAKT
ncbi:hypothetical protein A0O30_08470 [Pseudomonas sp. LLC-1]|nr:hypothetical protein A0O30_08470 [Pseudomonas sp. LLC-1]